MAETILVRATGHIPGFTASGEPRDLEPGQIERVNPDEEYVQGYLRSQLLVPVGGEPDAEPASE